MGNSESEDSDSDDSEFSDSGDESPNDTAEGTTLQQGDSSASAERGVLISFPYLELYGIELLEMVSLCITIKCDRCKTPMDVNNLRNNANSETSGLRLESCKKCAGAMSIGIFYRTAQ